MSAEEAECLLYHIRKGELERLVTMVKALRLLVRFGVDQHCGISNVLPGSMMMAKDFSENREVFKEKTFKASHTIDVGKSLVFDIKGYWNFSLIFLKLIIL